MGSVLASLATLTLDNQHASLAILDVQLVKARQLYVRHVLEPIVILSKNASAKKNSMNSILKFIVNGARSLAIDVLKTDVSIA